METKNLAILIFDQIELLDFCGPMEVFSVFNKQFGKGSFNIYTVAKTAGPVATHAGLKVLADHTLYTCPKPDWLVVPGGIGTRPLLEDESVLAWLRQCAVSAELLLSVCTGALVLGKAGLLDGLKATTHHLRFDELERCAPNAGIVKDVKFVENERVILSGGISAGIDMSLHVIASRFGNQAAQETADYMEYDWRA